MRFCLRSHRVGQVEPWCELRLDWSLRHLTPPVGPWVVVAINPDGRKGVAAVAGGEVVREIAR